MADKKNLEVNQPKNTQAQDDLDKELQEALDEQGDIFLPDQDDFKDPPKDKPEDKEDPPEEDPEEDKEEDKEEDQPEDNPPKDDKDPEDGKKPEEKPEDPPEKKEDKKQKKIERPKKFIPLDKYQDEKSKWKEDRENLAKANEKIAELEKIKDKEQNKNKEDKDLKKLAEKWDTPVEFIQDLMGELKKGNKIDPEQVDDKTNKEEKPVNQPPKDPTDDEIVEQFNKEFDGFVPEIKKDYQDASQEQLDEAKKLMDELAHSPRFNQYPLEDILKLNKGDFDLILSKTPDKPGLENGKSGGFKDISASSFKPDKSGNYDFSSLHDMPPGPKKDKIVDDLDPEVWGRYVDSMGSEDEKMSVKKKNGDIIHLK